MQVKSKNYNQYIIFLSSIVYFIIWIQFANSFDPIKPDSNGYLYFFDGTGAGNFRPSGYPIFLFLLSSLKLSINYIAYFQLGFFVFAIYFLMNSLVKYGLSKKIVFLLYLSLILNPFFNQFHFMILTESLSFSLLFIFLGLSLSLYQKIVTTKIIMLGTIIGFLAIIKPVSIIFLPIGLIFLIFLLRIFGKGSFKKIILCSILLFTPFFVIFTAEKLVFFSAHDKKYSQFAEHLYGKSIMLTTFSNFKIPDDDLPESKMLNLLDDKYSSDQEYLESIEGISEWLAIYSILENDAYKHPDLESELVLIASENGLDPKEFKKTIIFYSLKNNPTLFIRMMLRHYFSFFNVYPSGKYFNENGPPPHFINNAIDLSPSISKITIHYLFVIFGAIFYLCSAFILIKFLYLVYKNNLLNYMQYNRLFFLTLLLAALVHSIHLVHALFGVYVPRYLMFSYPYIILIELITIYQIPKFNRILSKAEGM